MGCKVTSRASGHPRLRSGPLFLPMASGPPAAADVTVRPSQAAASQDAGVCLNVTSAFPDHQSRVATISSAPLCSGPLQAPSHLCCVLRRLAPSPHKLQSVVCLLHAVFAPLEECLTHKCVRGRPAPQHWAQAISSGKGTLSLGEGVLDPPEQGAKQVGKPGALQSKASLTGQRRSLPCPGWSWV